MTDEGKRDFASEFLMEKAAALAPLVKCEGDFGRNIRFIVPPRNPEKNAQHLVFFSKDTKDFHCDCRAYALHPEKGCSHSIACQMFLDKLNEVEKP